MTVGVLAALTLGGGVWHLGELVGSNRFAVHDITALRCGGYVVTDPS